MNKQQVKTKVMTGNLVDCSAEEYPDVRRYLQEFAGESVDNGQIIYTQIALNEVARLDKKFAAVEHTLAADICPLCDGSGKDPNDPDPSTCPKCKGSGQAAKA